MTAHLYAAAVTATLLDGLAYLAFIVPGRVAEMNPIVASMDPRVALLARGLLLLGLGLLTIAAERFPKARRAVQVALGVAVVVGTLGFISTVAAA